MQVQVGIFCQAFAFLISVALNFERTKHVSFFPDVYLENMRVEELTANVAEQQRHLASEFTGVSDHLMHIQQLVIKNAHGQTADLTIATFNVLAQIWIWYQNGRPANGGPPPSWYNLADQQGFENCPMSNEAYAAQRQTAILGMIFRFLRGMEDKPAVLCLQECSNEIVNAIKAEFPGIELYLEPRSTNSFLVTVCYNVKALHGAVLGDRTLLLPLSLGSIDEPLWIVNGHLEFQTAKNEAIFAALSNILGRRPFFVVGDYNIPVMPISAQGKAEGCTKTLSEFVNESLVGKHGWHYDLACHNLHYTHWNCRKNCADPSSNVDHFDNILFLHYGDYKVQFTPLPAPEPGQWWEEKIEN